MRLAATGDGIEVELQSFLADTTNANAARFKADL